MVIHLSAEGHSTSLGVTFLLWMHLQGYENCLFHLEVAINSMQGIAIL